MIVQPLVKSREILFDEFLRCKLADCCFGFCGGEIDHPGFERGAEQDQVEEHGIAQISGGFSLHRSEFRRL